MVGRVVPEDRIKTLHARTIVSAQLSFDPTEMVKSILAEQMAAEIISKMFEFSKIDAEVKDGAVEYQASIDVIVPDRKKVLRLGFTGRLACGSDGGSCTGGTE